MSSWQVIVDRLMVLLPTLPGYDDVKVFDGPPNDPVPESGKYVTVGYVDGSDAGQFTAAQAGNGFQVVEDGTVRCAVVVDTRPQGLPTPMATVRSAAFALADALGDYVRSDRTLGVLPPSATCSLDIEVQSLAITAGSAQALILTLNYQTTS